MRQFKDTKGRAWDIVVNVATLKRVRDLTKVDLLKLFENGAKGIVELSGDLILFVNVLFAVCSVQAEKTGISDIDFGEAMNGDVLDEAEDKLFEEIIDFFPKPKREPLRTWFAKGKRARALLIAEEEKTVEDLDVEKRVARYVALQKMEERRRLDKEDLELAKYIEKFGLAPESLGLTPAPSPSAN